jgi:hypothetical protein
MVTLLGATIKNCQPCGRLGHITPATHYANGGCKCDHKMLEYFCSDHATIHETTPLYCTRCQGTGWGAAGEHDCPIQSYTYLLRV